MERGKNNAVNRARGNSNVDNPSQPRSISPTSPSRVRPGSPARSPTSGRSPKGKSPPRRDPFELANEVLLQQTKAALAAEKQALSKEAKARVKAEERAEELQGSVEDMVELKAANVKATSCSPLWCYNSTALFSSDLGLGQDGGHHPMQ
jgi:hypothetical protein